MGQQILGLLDHITTKWLKDILQLKYIFVKRILDMHLCWSHIKKWPKLLPNGLSNLISQNQYYRVLNYIYGKGGYFFGYNC